MSTAASTTSPVSAPASGSLAKRLGLLGALVALMAVLALPTPAGLPVAGQTMLAILAFAVIVWMTEALGYSVSAVVIAALLILFGLGMVPGLLATVIFVVPAPIRLTHLGVSSTPNALIEAATAFGATPRQKLWKVELPWALPQIMAGLNQTIMLSLSMVVIAAMVGANGLGIPVVRALGQNNSALGFESGIVIVVVAIMLDRMLRVTRK